MHHVGAPDAGIEQERKREPRLGADGVALFELGELLDGPGMDAFGTSPDVGDVTGRVVLGMTRAPWW